MLLPSNLPTRMKEAAISYFQTLWYDYYENGIEPEFQSIELRDLWFYLKVNCLSRCVNYMNLKAIEKLSKELVINCKKFENPNYRLGIYKAKGEY